MKVDEATLQNILKAYGQRMKPRKNTMIEPKKEVAEKDKVSKKLESEDLDLINYDKEGKVAINSNKKDALIDFFQ